MTSIYVCVRVCVRVHVCVVYEDTNVYNDMGMTQLLCHLIMTHEIIFYEKTFFSQIHVGHNFWYP